MARWIALLRGVNVGGHNKLPMKPLQAALAASGLTDVATYLQSGNIVFSHSGTHAKLAAQISDVIAAKFGFRPSIKLLRHAELTAAATANPFPEAEQAEEGKTLHLFFLDGAPAADRAAALDALSTPSERWALVGQVFYLHAPEGFGRSKLALQAERKLQTGATSRNWRSVCALLEMAGV
jgi:uncharacterized protein (DUF1697 family)